MKVISTFSLRDNLAKLLDEVINTDSPLVISRFGKPIALISPYKKSDILQFSNYFGFLGKGKRGKEFLDEVRRSKKEKDRTESFKRRKRK